MKKQELLKEIKIDRLGDTFFLTNRHVNFCYTVPTSILKPEHTEGVRYFGGLQCNFKEGSEKYKNIENWLCEVVELLIKHTK